MPAPSLPLERLVQFGRTLRDAGLGVTTGQIAVFVDALTLDGVDVTDRRTCHDVARATLVANADELDAFDAAFAHFWTSGARGAPVLPSSHLARLVPPQAETFTADPTQPREAIDASSSAMPSVVDRRLTWSATEVLRHARFDRLDSDDARRVDALVRALAWRIAPRRTRRFRRAARGTSLDWRRTAQQAVRDQGEWIERRWRVRHTAPRPLVVLADISGSMEAFSRMLLAFVHGLTQGLGQESAAARDPRRRHTHAMRTETFVFATRLTRITRALARRDVASALSDVATHVVDWAGGTRIGDCLHAFNRDWARRVLGRGAVVLIISDALDRGDPQRLAREVERVQRSCHRLIWLNPLLGTDGYEPRTRGLLAALPFVDDFLPVHNVASLEALARHLARLPSYRPASSEHRARALHPSTRVW